MTDPKNVRAMKNQPLRKFQGPVMLTDCSLKRPLIRFIMRNIVCRSLTVVLGTVVCLRFLVRVVFCHHSIRNVAMTMMSTADLAVILVDLVCGSPYLWSWP